MRTTAYLNHWHELYAEPADGLRVITVFAPAFDFTADPDVAEQLVRKAGVEHPVLLDLELRLWRIYENRGWPSRYLFDRELRLYEYHQGEGGYTETEQAIRELLKAEPLDELSPPLHPIDDPAARLVVPSAEEIGCWSGDYVAGEVCAVLEGSGTITVNGERREVPGPGSHVLTSHPCSTEGTLELDVSAGVTCHSVCFSPGLAPQSAEQPLPAT